jgi:type IV secretory pathway protease TraF
MSRYLDGFPATTGVFSLGPMDGQEQAIASDTDELCVAMTDGQQHRYLRSPDVQLLPDGRSAVVFTWTGRYYGPT